MGSAAGQASGSFGQAARWKRPNGLPAALNSLVGRERETQEACRLLSFARLLTLTGLFGVGKSRLALEVAWTLAGEYADGACLVELAPLSDPALVLRAVAAALGIEDLDREPDAALAGAVSDHLRPRQLLLVLDECEHLLGSCVELVHLLLHGCPKLKIIATSQRPLGAVGEAVFRVPCLSVPRDLPSLLASADPVRDLQALEAVRFFLAWASLVQPGFDLTADNAAAVAEICRQLDGLPLAVSLAAARVRLLTSEPIATDLSRHLRAIVDESPTGHARHPTIRAALDWSYTLLSSEERSLLDRLSVFAEGWTLEAAAAVAARNEVSPARVAELLSRLQGRSLVCEAEPNGVARYRMLETVRSHCLERLEARGEREDVLARHAAFFRASAERIAPYMEGMRSGQWLDRIERDHANYRAAMEWALEHREAEIALRIAGSLWGFWWARGHLAEGRAWLRGALTASRGSFTLARARGLLGAGTLAWGQGDLDEARSLLAESLFLSRALGDRQGIARALSVLGVVVHHQGDTRLANSLFEEALPIHRETGDVPGVATSLHSLGQLAARRGEWEMAHALLRESLGLHRELGSPLAIVESLMAFAALAASEGQDTAAVQLFGAGHTLRLGAGLAVRPVVAPLEEASLESVRGRLAESDFAEAWAAGQAMAPDQAMEYALALELPSSGHASPLTRRERQVATLIACGLSNAAIAAELVISERTAETHVGRALSKLGFKSRSQLALWAERQGLVAAPRD